ncbi:hypothetical protein VTK73DRAFT_7510 [Phialemonium thermophilum]|uniref:Ribosomal protein L32 n=1 Tax=Phialemonium thermophilum TaxID=223376 RepID=A0ABR3WE95_9PEZI
MPVKQFRLKSLKRKRHRFVEIVSLTIGTNLWLCVPARRNAQDAPHGGTVKPAKNAKPAFSLNTSRDPD